MAEESSSIRLTGESQENVGQIVMTDEDGFARAPDTEVSDDIQVNLDTPTLRAGYLTHSVDMFQGAANRGTYDSTLVATQSQDLAPRTSM